MGERQRTSTLLTSCVPLRDRPQKIASARMGCMNLLNIENPVEWLHRIGRNLGGIAICTDHTDLERVRCALDEIGHFVFKTTLFDNVSSPLCRHQEPLLINFVQ